MGYRKGLIIAAMLLAAGLAPATARELYNDGAVGSSPADYPGAPQPVYNDTKNPYAMNYADEASQTLGVRDGHMDLFATRPDEDQPYLPALSGGVDRDGAMLKLQWHPGE